MHTLARTWLGLVESECGYKDEYVEKGTNGPRCTLLQCYVKTLSSRHLGVMFAFYLSIHAQHSVYGAGDLVAIVFFSKTLELSPLCPSKSSNSSSDSQTHFL